MPINVKLNPSFYGVQPQQHIRYIRIYILFCQIFAYFSKKPRSYARPTFNAFSELGPPNYTTSRHVRRLGARPARVDPPQPYTGIPNVREVLPPFPMNT